MSGGAERRPISVVAVSGGLGSPSSTRLLADRVISHTERAFAAHGLGAQVRVIELRELAVPIASNLVTGYAEPALADALAALADADAIIAVTPVFNASVSGLFKSFFDLVEPDALRGIPVALAATGGSARHSLVIEYALRPLFAYLRTLPLPTGLFVATEEWGGPQAGIEERAARVARELVAAVLMTTPEPGTAADPAAGGFRPAGAAPAAFAAPSDGSTARMDDDPTAAGAPTIAATAADFGGSARAAQAKREEHDGFADLMARFAGTDVAGAVPEADAVGLGGTDAV